MDKGMSLTSSNDIPTIMPLFKCERCHTLENTALTPAYWGSDEKCCSACAIGKWHGHFPRQTPEEAGYEPEEEKGWFYKLKK